MLVFQMLSAVEKCVSAGLGAIVSPVGPIHGRKIRSKNIVSHSLSITGTVQNHPRWTIPNNRQVVVKSRGYFNYHHREDAPPFTHRQQFIDLNITPEEHRLVRGQNWLSRARVKSYGKKGLPCPIARCSQSRYCPLALPTNHTPLLPIRRNYDMGTGSAYLLKQQKKCGRSSHTASKGGVVDSTTSP